MASCTFHHAKSIPADADRRIALDDAGLPFPVIVTGDVVYDERLYPFASLRHGIPIGRVTFKAGEGVGG